MKPLKLHSLWLILGLLVCVGQAIAQESAFDPSVLSAEGKKAYEELLKVDFFAIGGIGYGAATSRGEASLTTIIAEKEAIGALKKIAAEGTTPGGLYAVLGMRTIKCDCLQAEVKKFEARTVEETKAPNGRIITGNRVATMTGCFALIEGKDDVLKRILTGFYDGWNR
jgi:hypothetical protein